MLHENTKKMFVSQKLFFSELYIFHVIVKTSKKRENSTITLSQHTRTLRERERKCSHLSTLRILTVNVGLLEKVIYVVFSTLFSLNGL